MQPIDTLYNGNFFRSRLEARWAFFFDQVNIRYEYEQQGFRHNGECYLPDFFLPDVWLRHSHRGVYIEIKPESYPTSNIPAGKWFTKPLVLFTGTPDKMIWGDPSCDGNGFQLYPGWDNCMAIWKCPKCGTFKIEFLEGNYDSCPLGHPAKNDYDFLKAAAQKTIFKRFEHA